jgi:hypothetical protein
MLNRSNSLKEQQLLAEQLKAATVDFAAATPPPTRHEEL